MDRTERQLEIIKKWKEHKGIGTVFAATGFGKTYLGVLSALEIRERYPGGKIVVVVPRIPLVEEWKNAFERAGLDNYEVLVVNTAVKRIKKEPIECLHKIFDEGHHYSDGKEFPKVKRGIHSKTALMLSAYMESEPPYPIIDQVSKKECLRNGWVSDHEIYNLAVPLTEEELKDYERIHGSFKHYESLLGGKFRAFSRAAEYRKFIQIKKEPENFLINKYSNKAFKRSYIEKLYNSGKVDDLSKYREPSSSEIEAYYSKARMAVVYFQQMNLRKKLLCQAENKIYAIRDILEAFSERKAVIFSEHRKFADSVNEVVDNSYLYHSGRTDKQNREALEAFKNVERSTIISAKSLNEGVNVPDCSLGIAAAGNSKILDNIQREGRIIRKQNDKRALFINLFVPDTQDEKWLKKRQRDDAIYVNSVREILDLENELSKIRDHEDQVHTG